MPCHAARGVTSKEADAQVSMGGMRESRYLALCIYASYPVYNGASKYAEGFCTSTITCVSSSLLGVTKLHFCGGTEQLPLDIMATV